MIDNELFAKFDRIQDLPFSEKMLGAYMEGKVDLYEASQIESVVSGDSALSDLLIAFPTIVTPFWIIWNNKYLILRIPILYQIFSCQVLESR